MDHAATIERRLAQGRVALEALAGLAPRLPAAIQLVIATLQSGGTVFTCGNGGSAAEALHLAEELTGRYQSNRAAQRAVCLCADSTALTCIANDFGFEQIFARQLEALARPGDLLVAFSTSGKSPNLLRALETARRLGVSTLGLLGRGGGAALAHCTHALVVEGTDGAATQEAHQMILHILCESCEHLAAPPR
jgi:D-sedoheptulose 7-phosphate isomerase